jgi:hypothetical protein
MGKAQKKRAARRHNPMRVPDSHLPKGLASASQSSSKADAVLPIIQKVRLPPRALGLSADLASRRWTAQMPSNENGHALPCLI